MSTDRDPAEDRIKWLLRHRCQNCNNVNTSHAKRDWLNPPVECNECGQMTWELIEKEELA